MQETNLVFFNLENKVALEQELYEHYASDENFLTSIVSDFNDLKESVVMSSKSLIIAKIENKADFLNIITLLKTQRRKVRNSSLKVAIFNLVKNKKVEKVLASYGSREFLTTEMNNKTCFFKIDFWTRALKDDLIQESTSPNKKSFSRLDVNAPKSLKSAPVNFLPALDKEEDIWILKNRNDCKYVLQKWLIRLKGPTAHACYWEDISQAEAIDQKKWRLCFKEGFEPESIGIFEGDWIFVGMHPEFDWKLGLWTFSGAKPTLYFETSNEFFERFFFNESELTMRENSSSALKKEELLEETKDIKVFKAKLENKDTASELYFNSKSKSSDSNDEAYFDEEDLGGHYSGEVHTKNKKQSPHDLASDQKTSGRLKGALKNIFNENQDYIIAKNNSEFQISELDLLESGEFVIEVIQENKNGDIKTYRCRFEDLFESELVALFDVRYLLEIAPVKINMSFSYLDETVTLDDLQGQVVEIEEYNHESHLAVIDLVNVNEIDVRRLMRLYHKRQNAINIFMQRAKGY